jgi:hypothetical protein
MSFANLTSPHVPRSSEHNRPLFSGLTRPVAFCLLFAASIVRAQPFPSFQLDTTRVIGPDMYRSWLSASAFCDSVGLIVWDGGGGFKAARVDRRFELLDSLSLLLEYKTYGSLPVDVASSGSSFLAVAVIDTGLKGDWEDSSGVVAICVSQGGTIVRRTHLRSTALNCDNPAVAYGADRFLAVWYEFDGESRVFYARTASDGVLLDSPPRPLCPARVGKHQMDVAFGDSMFLVAWTEEGGLEYSLRCARVSPQGEVLDTGGVAIPVERSARLPHVAYNGRDFIVTWVDSGYSLRGSRVTTAGVVLDSAGVQLADSVFGYSGVECIGETTLVAWTKLWGNSVSIRARRCDGSLAPLDSTDVALSPSYPRGSFDQGADFPAVGSWGSRFVATWSQLTVPYTSRDPVCVRVTSTGKLLDSVPVQISRAADAHYNVAIASSGHGFLAAWIDYRPGIDSTPHGLRIAAVDKEGVVSPPRYLHDSTDAVFPRAAYGPGFYLVCWEGSDQDDIYAARVTDSAVVLDAPPIQIRTGPGKSAFRPDVAFCDSVFLVVWIEDDNRVYGVRVRPDGILADSVPLKIQRENQSLVYPPRVESDGDNFLVAFRQAQTFADKFLRVSTAGEILDSTEIVIRGGGRSYPDPVFGAGVYFVLDPAHYKGFFMSPAGELLDSMRVYADSLSPITAVFDDTNFVVVGSSPYPPFHPRGVRVTPAGRILDTRAIVLASDCEVVDYLASAAATPGHVAALFPSNEPAPYLSRRARVTVSRLPGTGTAELTKGTVSGLAVAPNPVSSNAVISLSLFRPATIAVGLYDATGRCCKVVRQNEPAVGTYRIALDMSGLASGVYFARVQPGDTRLSLTVIR